jgi:hypothetical protein
MYFNTTGENNTALGHQALQANTTASNGTAVGFQAGYANTTGVGLNAFGYQVLSSNTTGKGNSAFGGLIAAEYDAALKSNTTGNYNAGFASGALQANTTGANNTAVGMAALYNNTTGTNNTALGFQALYSNTGTTVCTAVGSQALYNNRDESQTAVGYRSFYNLNATSSAGGNTALGTESGTNKTSGFQCIYIGVYSAGANATTNQEIVIGTQSTTGKGSSTAFINANGGGTYNGANTTTWATVSDRRIKKNIVDNNAGLEAISKIQVRNFEYRTADEVIDLPQEQAIKKEGIQLGVIAQELQQVLPECVKTESTGVLTVDTDNLTWYLINAVKELKAEIDQLKGK